MVRWIGEAALLHVAAECDKKVPLYAGERVLRQPRFDAMRDREINIVASEKQMVADRDSLDVRNRRSGLGGDLKKCEVSRAAADINNQDVMGALSERLLPSVALRVAVFQPTVKCGLRFLQKADILGIAGLTRRVQGKPLSHGIKRRRYRNSNILFFELESFGGELGVP